MRPHLALITFLILCLTAPHGARGEDGVPGQAEGRRVSFTMQYKITGKPGTDKVVLTALVPKSIDGRQKILKVQYAPRPEREFEEKGNKYARFVLNKPVGEQVVTINVDAELYRYDLTVAARSRRSEQESRERLKPWLAHEKFIEKDAPEIQAAAKTIEGTDEMDTLRNIMAFVHQKVRFTGFDDTDRGAFWALKNGKGDCTEFSDLFAALCRAKGIPARVWEGYLTDEVPRGEAAKHIRVEVYTRKHGWVPFDPLHVARRSATFDGLKPIYVYFGSQRNDTVLQNHHYVAYRYFGQPVTLESSFTVAAQRDLKRR